MTELVLTVRSGGKPLAVKQSLSYGKLVMWMDKRHKVIVKVSSAREDIRDFDIVVALPSHDHYSDNPRSNVWVTYHAAELAGKATYMIFRDGSILGPNGKVLKLEA
jgi:hypothetical protein